MPTLSARIPNFATRIARGNRCGERRICPPAQFPRRVYIVAADLFAKLRRQPDHDRSLIRYDAPSEDPLPELQDERARRFAYNLAFRTLKYQELLEEILVGSGFYSEVAPLSENMSLLLVLLSDLQCRNFCTYGPPVSQDDGDSHVEKQEWLLLRWRTKLRAEQARVRIRRDVPSFEALLPEAMQIREAFGIAMPVYVWVNQNLTRMHSVLEALKWSGYTYVEPVAGQLQASYPDGSKQIVQQDRTCPDVLIFPSHVRENLQASPLISEGHLVLQDKSQCFGPQSVLCLFEAGDDVLVVPGCSFPTLAHLCSLLSSWRSHIFVCQPSEDPARTTLNAMCQRLHCKGITLLPEQFLSLAPGDQRLARVSIVLVMPPCSASGINNPVNFILQEGIDPETLPNLCLATTATEEKLGQLSKQQLQLLQHAMCLSGPRAIVYNTCSVYEAENEDVVHTALEIARTDSSINTYQLGPPVLFPWKMDEFGDARESFLKLTPSLERNGSFTAVLLRQPDAAAPGSSQKALPHDVTTSTPESPISSQVLQLKAASTNAHAKYVGLGRRSGQQKPRVIRGEMSNANQKRKDSEKSATAKGTGVKAEWRGEGNRTYRGGRPVQTDKPMPSVNDQVNVGSQLTTKPGATKHNPPNPHLTCTTDINLGSTIPNQDSNTCSTKASASQICRKHPKDNYIHHRQAKSSERNACTVFLHPTIIVLPQPDMGLTGTPTSSTHKHSEVQCNSNSKPLLKTHLRDKSTSSHSFFSTMPLHLPQIRKKVSHMPQDSISPIVWAASRW